MNTNELQTSTDNILTVLSELDDKTDIFNFLQDLLTQKEISEFSRRFEVAILLTQKVSYVKIEEQTKMSSTTIARISKFLKGENVGYKTAISILKSVYNRHHTDHHS